MLTRPEDFGRYRYTKFEWRLPERRAAAQVGGIGIAPGGINYITGHAAARHRTEIREPGQGELGDFGEMMFRYMG